MQNKTFLKRISRKVCMQRYNGVIEGEHAKKCFLEIGDKWIFSTHGQNLRGGIQLHGRGGFRGSQISHTTNVNFSHFPNFHKHLHSTLLVVIWYSALTCWRALAIT